MKRSKWLVFVCIVATLGLTGCSDDDDPVVGGPPGPAQAEAAIEGVLDSVVDPLLLAVEALIDYLNSALSSSSTRATCPDASDPCSPGTLSCASTSAGWDFTFSGCTVVGTAPPLGLDGGVEVTPGGHSWFWLDMDNLSINGSPGLNGMVTHRDECNSSWDITSDGLHVVGTIIACSDQNPQPSSSLLVEIQQAGQWIVNFTFDGTATASAIVTLDNTPIASCSVDLDTFDATCTGVDI